MRRSIAFFLWAALLTIATSALAQSPPYLLSPDEAARYRSLEGKATPHALGGRNDPLMRVIRRIAGQRVIRHSGHNWSVLETFNHYLGGPPDSLVVEQDRLLFGSGCRGPECEEGGALVVDLETGQVAIAIAHLTTAEGRPGRVGVTAFLMACADPAFRRLARERLLAWGQKVLWADLEEDRVHTLTTPCKSTAAPVREERPALTPGSPLLTKAEIAGAKTIAGPTRKLFDAAPTRPVLMRVLSRLAGEGSSRMSGEELPHFQMLVDTFRRSEVSIAKLARFHIGRGCHDGERTCAVRSSLIIDTQTGDVVVLLRHDFDEAGNRLDIKGVTIFATRCAGRDIRDHVMEVARYDGEMNARTLGWPVAEAPKPRVLEAPCG